MQIGIDLDDVLGDTNRTLNAYHNNIYGTSFTREHYLSYKYWDIWGGTREDAIRKFDHFAEQGIFEAIPPIEGALYGMKRLKDISQGTAHVITGRSESSRNSTEQWLTHHFPGEITSLHFTNVFPVNGEVTRRKGDLCRELGITLMIDDSLEFAQTCTENGIAVIIFDAPWNKSADLPPNTYRALGWHEIVDIAERIFQTRSPTPQR